MSRSPEHCIFCHLKVSKRPKEGEAKKTSEHVPPRGFFPRKLPSDVTSLVTVPACSDCNHEKGFNDDFLREALLLLAKPASNMARDLYEGPHLSSLRKDRRKYEEWSARVVGTQTNPRTGESIPVLKVEAAPIRKSLSDIARGMLWHLEKRLVPVDTADKKDLNGNKLQFFQAHLPSQLFNVKFLLDAFPANSVSGYVGHPEIFEYRLWRFSSDQNWMTWYFRFFGGANLFVTTREIIEQLFANPPSNDPRVAELLKDFIAF